MSPVSYEKSPTFDEKSATFDDKSPTYNEKSPVMERDLIIMNCAHTLCGGKSPLGWLWLVASIKL